MVKFLSSLFVAFTIIFSVRAADPTATAYTAAQCEGSSMPYPAVTATAVPDSLRAVMINHVGRHGARFLSSGRFVNSLLRTLAKADSLHTLTPAGRELQTLCNTVVSRTAGRWGALDSLGMAEQRSIASRMVRTYPGLVKDSRIHAISSYVPRCIASMDEFTHQISRLDNKVEIFTSSGRQNSALLRPYDSDEDYRAYISSDGWRKVYEDYLDSQILESIAAALLGRDFPFEGDEARDFALNLYKLISGSAAMGMSVDYSRYITLEQYNALWRVDNLHHYLTYSASTLTPSVTEMAAPLLLDIITTTDKFIAGENPYSIELRFGHAETLMPLLALIHAPGCYYMTNYFDTVGLHWRDFHVVPMAANLQLILFQDAKGDYIVRMDLNESPVSIIPGRSAIYVPWATAREYFIKCLPMMMQP